jgi:hypothetical protein
VAINESAYSFWVNPVENFRGSRLDSTILLSFGKATRRFLEEWRGPTTDYDVYGAPGSSGSPVYGQTSSAVIGVTSCALAPEGPFRCTADTDHFLRRFDADRNLVLDAVEYDWLSTDFAADYHRLRFDTPTRRAEWLPFHPTPGRGELVVGGDGAWVGRVTAGSAAETDGLWHAISHFRNNGTYRVGLRARGTLAGQTSYVKFRSELGNRDEVIEIRPGVDWQWITGRVQLGDWPDYRLVLGTRDGVLDVSEIALVREEGRLNFETGAERRSWDYQTAHPTSWGIGGPGSFSAVADGPCRPVTTLPPPGPDNWCLANRRIALRANTDYEIRFTAQHVSGSTGTATVSLWGSGSGSGSAFRFGSTGERVDVEVTIRTTVAMDTGLYFDTRERMSFMVDNVQVRER